MGLGKRSFFNLFRVTISYSTVWYFVMRIDVLLCGCRVSFSCIARVLCNQLSGFSVFFRCKYIFCIL